MNGTYQRRPEACGIISVAGKESSAIRSMTVRAVQMCWTLTTPRLSPGMSCTGVPLSESGKSINLSLQLSPSLPFPSLPRISCLIGKRQMLADTDPRRPRSSKPVPSARGQVMEKLPRKGIRGQKNPCADVDGCFFSGCCWLCLAFVLSY